MPPTCFAVDKTDAPNIYKAYTRLTVVTKVLSEALQAYNSLCGSLNGLSESLQASYVLSGNQNGLSDVQLASNTLCGSQNGRSEPLTRLRTSTRLIHAWR